MGSPLRRSAAASAIALLAVIGPAARGGGSEEDSAARRLAAGKSVAARLVAFGNWCKGRSFKAMARRQYQEAIRFDPDDAAARAGLGQRLVEGRWRLSGSDAAGTDPPTSSPSSLALAEKESEAAHVEAAAILAEHAEWCATSGLAAGAKGAWTDVLFLDPGHGAARKALGLEGADTAWLTVQAEGPAAFEARAIKAAAAGLARYSEERAKDPASCPTEWGTGWTETREARFSVRSSTSKAPSRVLIDDMLHSEALWVALGVVDPRKGGERSLRIVVVGSRDEYAALVDSLEGKDAAWKAARRNTGGCWPEPGHHCIWGWQTEWIRDTTVHDTAHFLFNCQTAYLLQPWIYEGAGVLTSTLLRGRAEMSCVALNESTTAREKSGALDWNEEVRRLLRAGDDPPIANLAVSGTNDLQLPSLAKARSMVAWMALHSPGALRAVLAGSVRGEAPAAVLQAAFGCPPEAIERRWRAWARRP